MAVQDTSAMPARLAFGTTFGAAFSTVFGRLWSFIKAALLPFLVSILLGMVGFAALSGAPMLVVPLQILSLLPIAILGIACCRLALIGRQAGAVPRPLFGRRTWVYFGYSLLFALLLWLPLLVVGIALLGNATMSLMTAPEVLDYDRLANLGLAVLLLIPVYLVYLYFMLRLSLVFPAVAVDEKLGMRGSWQLTRGGAGFKLYGVFVVLAIVLLVGTIVILLLANVVSSLFSLAPGSSPQGPDDTALAALILMQAPIMVLTLLLEYLGFAVMIAALASAFAQLSGWGGPREEILERFE